MAKLFVNLANNTGGLQTVLNDSSIDTQFLPLSKIENLTYGSATVTKPKRLQSIYDLYTKIPPAKTFEFQVSDQTLDDYHYPITISRKRPTGFYDEFASANILNIPKNPVKNNTLIEIKPYSADVVSSDKMQQNSQSSPTVSGPRDNTRMVSFLQTRQGVQFLLSQQLLQAGNTFGQSRQYNLLTVPVATANYSVATLSNPLERVSRLIYNDTLSNPELSGRLQQETVISAQTKLRLKFVGGSTKKSPSSVSQAISTSATIAFGGFELGGFIGQLGNTVGQIGNKLNTLSDAANSFARGLNASNSTLSKDRTPYDALYEQNLWPLLKTNDGNIRNFEDEKQAYIETAQFNVRNSIAKLNGANSSTNPLVDKNQDYRSSADYTDSVRASSGTATRNGIVTARYMKDKMNLKENGLAVFSVGEFVGATANDDYIQFRVSVPSVFDEGLLFRAFIEDFKHTGQGQYDEVRYVGRPERFITYKGMNRSVNFSLYLVAFSELELNGMWAKANMLNKLIYPINNAGGFMVPPICRITIGNVLTDQPGYIQSIDMNFTDLPWDIDNEVPTAIKLTIEFNIIEKDFVTQSNLNNTLFQEYKQMKGLVNDINVNVPSPELPDLAARTPLALGTAGSVMSMTYSLLPESDKEYLKQFRFGRP